MEEALPDSDANPVDHDPLNRDEHPPTDPKRLSSFATFFKNYMSVSAILAGAAPIPVALFDLIPQYDALRKLTTTLSSLLAFLALAYIFFNRSSLGQAWFGSYLLNGAPTAAALRRQPTRLRVVGLLLLLLIFLSITSLVFYLIRLENSVRTTAGGRGVPPSIVLANAEWGRISNCAPLIMYLMGFFILAEAAFIVMALREYTQDLLGITDRELILSVVTMASKEDRIVKNAADLVAHGKAVIADWRSEYVDIRDLRTGYVYSLNRPEFEAALASEQTEAPAVTGPTEPAHPEAESDAVAAAGPTNAAYKL
jgi:hypothetical protein